jgi:hypothetical protein
LRAEESGWGAVAGFTSLENGDAAFSLGMPEKQVGIYRRECCHKK